MKNKKMSQKKGSRKIFPEENRSGYLNTNVDKSKRSEKKKERKKEEGNDQRSIKRQLRNSFIDDPTRAKKKQKPQHQPK